MWDGVTYVEPSHGPVIHEGEEAATIIVTNAGPATVRLKAWRMTRPDGPATVDLQLRPGNTRSVSGNLIRAALAKDDLHPRYCTPSAPAHGVAVEPFAALGWRVVR